MSKTYHSFKEAFDAMGYKPKQKKNAKPKNEKVIKCRICGAPMVHHEGSNVVTCSGTIKTKDGTEKPCNNFILWE